MSFDTAEKQNYILGKKFSSYIDLRSEHECKEMFEVLASFEEKGLLEQLQVARREDRYKELFVTNKEFIRKTAIDPAPLWWQVIFYLSYLLGFRSYARKKAFKRILQIIDKKKHEGLYKDFLRFSARQIIGALQVMSDSKNLPAMFFCMQGKDRTGLVAALLMHIMGASEEEIIADYVKSQHLLPNDFMIHKKVPGFSDQMWFMTPPEAMRNTLRWMRDEFGSIDGYLNYHGFGAEQRENLRSVLRKRSAL